MTDTASLAALLRRHLPHALAIADPGGSVEDDWTGSEYADVMAGDLAARLIAAGVTLDPLDVERLARALEAVPGPWPEHWTTGTLATAIAREYTAQAEP